MRCYATYNLLNAETLDPLLYPVSCFPVPPAPCMVTDFRTYPGPFNLARVAAGTTGYAVTPPVQPTHTITASGWTNTDWVINVFQGGFMGPATFQGTIKPTVPSINVTSTPDLDWSLCFKTTGASSVDVLWT